MSSYFDRVQQELCAATAARAQRSWHRRLWHSTRGRIAGGLTLALLIAAPAAATVAHWQWPTNSRGQSYGSDGTATSNASTPDLVSVIATNGRLGYAYAAQVNATPTFTSPAQAVASDDAPPRYIPVYTSDGTTVIGRFEVSEGSDYKPPTTAPTVNPRGVPSGARDVWHRMPTQTSRATSRTASNVARR